MSLKSSSLNGPLDQSLLNFSRRLNPRQRGNFAAVGMGNGADGTATSWAATAPATSKAQAARRMRHSLTAGAKRIPWGMAAKSGAARSAAGAAVAFEGVGEEPARAGHEGDHDDQPVEPQREGQPRQ